ncbi:DUF354 domain-containing protein [Tenuifilum thalassicum]|uniref:DUF354 domain-containing protein n=1 Tax=Tenuifilum thalassicum TaxID=2590900 RepID=A0A7D4CF74_9BACT|nr:DUF354 domain-containing protein [Tenuifilum thalassicum]QKG78806.1 DUF354 domain-containing protein [Tenuifilum thalassicum]
MNLLFDIGHPGQVHLFRNAINILKEKGHNVVVTAKNSPNILDLLEKLNIKYFNLGDKYDELHLKAFNQIKYNKNLLKIVNSNKIDIGIGSSLTIAQVSKISRIKSIILDDDDTDAVKLFAWFAHPFADAILSPIALKHDRKRKKDILYSGTHELFYLHPNYFSPDPNILKQLGISSNETFFVLRFVSGKAYHDIGENWVSLKQKLQIIDKLSRFGKIFITTERVIEPELAKWQLKLSPEKIHSLLYYAKMFIGDSQTMTSEAAILGTPAYKCNSFAHRLSVPNMLEYEYGLCYSYKVNEFDKLINKISHDIEKPDIKKEWEVKRQKFLSDSIDPTAFLVWFIENYPKSAKIMKENPDYQYNFK